MPEWKQEITQQLADLKLEPVREAEIVEELAQHLDDRYRGLLASGMAEAEAHRATLAELSQSAGLQRELQRVEQTVRQEPVVLGAEGRSNLLVDLWQDLRYGARLLVKHPGFAAVVVLTLALGIGVNTALFTFFNVWLRPLPIKDPASVVNLTCRAFPDYLYYRDHSEVFSGLIARSSEALALGGQTSADDPQTIIGEFVSDNYFSVLGASPALGRAFAPEENNTPGKAPVAVLSHRFWQNHFGADPGVIGQTLSFNGKAFTIIGVMERDFIGFDFGNLPDLWLPLMMRNEVPPAFQFRPRSGDWFGTRDAMWLSVAGRLKPGRSLEEARAEMAVLFNQLARAYSEIDINAPVGLYPATLLPAENGNAFWQTMASALGVTAIVLLITCANLANLLLARAASRQKEIGVRLALGASRSRVVRQLLAESMLLAGLGGAAGLLLAWWSLKAFLAVGVFARLGFDDDVFRAMPSYLDPDVRVLAYTLALSFVTGIAFGLVPALRATRSDLVTTLKDEGAGFGQRLNRSWLRSGLVVAQVALCMVLLIAAGLLLHGVIRAGAIDPGFETARVLAIYPRLELSGYDQSRALQFYEQLTARLESLPDVQAVSHGGVPIGALSPVTLTLPGTGEVPARAFYNTVSPNFFATLGIPIVRGRGFTEDEMRAGATVIIVTETTARNLWPDQEPIGQMITVKPGGKILQMGAVTLSFAHVIGVARDAQVAQLGEVPPYYLYAPLAPRQWIGTSLLVRTAREAKLLTAQMRAVARTLDPTLRVNAEALDDHIATSRRVATARAASGMATGLGLLALLLAAGGLYGVMTYSVAQRTHEIGIRMALGAQAGDVLRLMLGQGLRLVGVGVALGVGTSMALSRALASLLLGLSPFDPLAYVGVSLFLMVIATAAIYWPARRAARVDPLVALRYE